jgi:hypothetical protein
MVNYLIYGLLFAASVKPVLPNTAIAALPKPIVLTWQMLFKVVMEEKYSAKYKMKIEVPKFDDSLWEINKKEVIVEGFVIPTGINSNSFALSQNPFSSCFFCGQAGPETVMTIKYKGKAPKYKTDDYITLKGTFELNDKNIEEFIYILNNAVEVKK